MHNETASKRQKGKSIILIMAGGTGGHVIPALAVAKELKRRGNQVEWLGTQRGIESELVPKSDINLNLIDIAGVRGKGIGSWLKLPILLLKAVFQARSVIEKIQPNVVLGMGGFASGPGGIAAKTMRIPLVVHEQNAVAGTTNRYLAKIANLSLEAFPKSLPNAQLVGNPVRTEIVEIEKPEIRFSNRRTSKNLLVLGGSLGAQKLNELVPLALEKLNIRINVNVWHQTGKAHLATTKTAYQGFPVSVRVDDFIEDMAEAYSWADLVICRAGALTVSELTAAGVGSILVPFPFAIDDHQTKNAMWLVKNNAGVIRQQSSLTPEHLLELLTGLLSDKSKLEDMANNARQLALSNATNEVAGACLAVAV